MSEDFVSKTARKKQMLAMQELGAQVLTLDQSAWQALQLSEEVQAAMREYKRLKTHEARRRQLQFIGKLMRDYDAQRFTNFFAQQASGQRRNAIHAQELPTLFSQLIAGDSQALTTLFERYPAANRQQVTTLLRLIGRHNGEPGYPPSDKYQKRLWQLLTDLTR